MIIFSRSRDDWILLYVHQTDCAVRPPHKIFRNVCQLLPPVDSQSEPRLTAVVSLRVKKYSNNMNAHGPYSLAIVFSCKSRSNNGKKKSRQTWGTVNQTKRLQIHVLDSMRCTGRYEITLKISVPEIRRWENLYRFSNYHAFGWKCIRDLYRIW